MSVETAPEDSPYLDIEQGLAPLINIYSMYVLSPEGSPEEKNAENAMVEMVETLARVPDKAELIISALLALTFELRAGGNIHDSLSGIFPLISNDDPDGLKR